MLKKFIPDVYASTIYDISYTKLYESGKRLILTDLDNTLISYKETDPTQELYKWKEEVMALGFEIIIVSNSKKHRVEHFAELLGLKYVKFAKKPLKSGFKKAVKIAEKKYKKEEIIEFGDQVMTDVFGSRRCGFTTYLFKAIDKKTEKRVTRFNRKLENIILKLIKKKYPNLFEEKLSLYLKERDN